jgi:polyisoprenyl-phosphate glycosyltransferase
VTSPELSVVVPMFNEQEMAEVFHAEATRALTALGGPYELIFVNDGSRDGTLQKLLAIQGRDAAVRVLDFSRNFGHQAAMSAGLDAAEGRAVVIMDGDLQDPPALLGEMMAKWREGFDVVYAVRRSREGETLFKKITAHLFYRFLRVAAGIDLPVDTGDFRLMDRAVVDAIRALPERNRFLRGLVSWIGFRQAGVPFDRPARAAGETKFPLRRMARFAWDGITSFSVLPLRLVTLAGLGCAGGSLVVLGWAFYVRLFTERAVAGWTSLMGVVLFLGGLQLLSLGVIGEYLARVFDEAKRRPLYLVRRRYGFPEGRALPGQ